jgi:hypothetical protein
MLKTSLQAEEQIYHNRCLYIAFAKLINLARRLAPLGVIPAWGESVSPKCE